MSFIPEIAPSKTSIILPFQVFTNTINVPEYPLNGTIVGVNLFPMTNENEAKGFHTVEEIFGGDWALYERYFRKALTFLQDAKKSRSISMRDVVPEYLEIEFVDIKSPRLFFPRFKGTIVVQIPSRGLSTRQRGAERERRLLQFSPSVKLNEIAMADQFAIRMKVIESSRSKPVES